MIRDTHAATNICFAPFSDLADIVTTLPRGKCYQFPIYNKPERTVDGLVRRRGYILRRSASPTLRVGHCLPLSPYDV